MRVGLLVVLAVLLAGHRAAGQDLLDPPAPPHRFDASAGFLLWFLDTADGASPGLQASAGWLGDRGLGLGVSGFFLGRQVETHSLRGKFLAPTGPDPDSGPVYRAAVRVDHSTDLWGAEVTPYWRASQDGTRAIDVITGFKFVQYEETLGVLAAGTVVAAGDADRARFESAEQYRATNDFYGGTIGARLTSSRGALFWDVIGKVSLGGMRQVVDRTGGLRLSAAEDRLVALPIGLYPSTAYANRRSETRFAVLPEGDFKVGYQFTDWMNAFVGYSVLYVSSVARPGDQISVAPIPTSPLFSQPTARPAALGEIIDNDLWVHGINFGITVRY